MLPLHIMASTPKRMRLKRLAGDAAVAIRRGPHNATNKAYKAIGKWMAANRRESARHPWEIYGRPDPADTETMIVHLRK
jgi:hypothetical protein